ncbi:ABC transporter permease [Spirosoma aerolatum]|uniref:ABC transporter permease n=1 Tax=Spirosoma aerolatum TaxID=1211326 RepID=UPI0009AF09DF|nr:ABC transporter permease [Spirosoma aerolatum]
MNLVRISWANLRDKPLSSFLSGLLMTLGITIISLLLLLNDKLEDQFTKNAKGVDMVLGAKGSPLQLILSSIYQIDAPTGNIPLAEAQQLTRNPMVKTAIPLAMGDNYQSFRIVGTNHTYLTHYGATVGQGRLFTKSLEVVVGTRVAQVTGLKIGDQFYGSHGMDAGGDVHKDKSYRVVGLLNPSNSVVDGLILTPIASVWAVHEHGEAQTDEAHADQEAAPAPVPESDGPTDRDPTEKSREITSMLIQFRNPLGMMLARGINSNSKLQAALPAIEINRLFSLLGVGVDTLRYLALAIMVISGISVFVSLYNSLKERKYEMALMLSMGATRTQLFGMLLLEGLALSLIGFLLGVVLSRIGLALFSAGIAQEFHYSLTGFRLLPQEWLLLVAAVGIGLLAAALPAIGVYRMNISQTLAEE